MRLPWIAQLLINNPRTEMCEQNLNQTEILGYVEMEEWFGGWRQAGRGGGGGAFILPY